VSDLLSEWVTCGYLRCLHIKKWDKVWPIDLDILVKINETHAHIAVRMGTNMHFIYISLSFPLLLLLVSQQFTHPIPISLPFHLTLPHPLHNPYLYHVLLPYLLLPLNCPTLTHSPIQPGIWIVHSTLPQRNLNSPSS
jgi:hypothetical protein